MISIKDIAIKANVSTATVSKALNNRKDISLETRERIKRIANEMGYIADSSARALRTRRTYNIGVVFSDDYEGLANAYYSKILEAFKNEAEKNGYNISFVSNENENSISYVNYCEKRNFDGVAIINTDYTKENVRELIDSDIPLVTLDGNFENCISVLSDNLSGITKIVDYAVSMGHKKIAFIHGQDSQTTSNRLAGFYEAIKRHKLNIPDEYVIDGTYYYARPVLEGIEELSKLDDPPTCVLVPDDYSAMAIKSLDLDRKYNISYAGFDGLRITRALKIATYEQNTMALGRTAARKLIELIEYPDMTKEHIIVPGKLIEGDSIKRIK